MRKKKPARVCGHLRRTAGSEQRARHDRETSLNRQSERLGTRARISATRSPGSLTARGSLPELDLTSIPPSLVLVAVAGGGSDLQHWSPRCS